MSYGRVKILKFSNSNSIFLNVGENLGIAESVHMQVLMASLYREVAKEDNILAGTHVGARFGQVPTEYTFSLMSTDILPDAMNVA